MTPFYESIRKRSHSSVAIIFYSVLMLGANFRLRLHYVWIKRPLHKLNGRLDGCQSQSRHCSKAKLKLPMGLIN
jgi:hypothetical protein